MPDISRWTSGLFVPNRRSIGGIHAQVTISEEERDELQITEHPVEQGAPISDHAFKRPSEVRIKAGWSRCQLGANGGSGMYGLLLSWQAALNPFDLYTGKRAYKDMLIQSITITTDSHSEFALMADLVLRQVIIVQVQTSNVSKLTSQNPSNQKDPQSNASPTEKGDQQPRSVSNESDLGVQTPQENPGYDEAGSAPGSGKYSSVEPEDIKPGPEGAKVENTISNNDPGGVIVKEKGITNADPSEFIEGPPALRPPTRAFRPPNRLSKFTERERIAMTNRTDYQRAKRERNVMASWPRM